jgi:prophage maintenance system killer protein
MRGGLELQVSLDKETVWLSLNQLSELFGRDKSVVSRHLANIFKSNELDRKAVVAKNATTAADGKIYQVDYYNLDAIISVGYRINSSQATKFRIWATKILHDHIIKGYTLNQNQLTKNGLKELEQSLMLIQQTLYNQDLISDLGKDVLRIVTEYAKSWRILLAYDEDQLSLVQSQKQPHNVFTYEQALNVISTLKANLMGKGEASPLFGNEREHGLAGILGNIEQTFGGELLYPTVEEKAANLLYFVIKDHPFTDGNKRIACLLFIAYLSLQGTQFNLNDNGMIALALLTAESSPAQKDLMVRLITNLIGNESEDKSC